LRKTLKATFRTSGDPFGHAARHALSVAQGGVVSLFVIKSIDALKAEAGAQNEGMRRRTRAHGPGACSGGARSSAAGIFVLTGPGLRPAHAGPPSCFSMLLGRCGLEHWPDSATRSLPPRSRCRARRTPTPTRRWASWWLG
jgi:hypothetical protein